MSVSECLVCGRAHRGGFACGGCLAQVRRQLRDLPGLAAEVDTQAARLGRRGAGAGARSAVRPLPFNEDAARVAEELRSVLVGWCRDVCATWGAWPVDTVPAMTARLAAHGWANDPAVDEFADELAWTIKQARSAIDSPAPRAYLGPCSLGQQAGCRREVWARPAATTVTCPACESVIDVAARQLALLDACADTLAHAELIGQALTTLATPVKPATIRQWARRGRLLAKGTDRAGRPLYLVSECRALAAQAAVRTARGASA